MKSTHRVIAATAAACALMFAISGRTQQHSEPAAARQRAQAIGDQASEQIAPAEAVQILIGDKPIPALEVHVGEQPASERPNENEDNSNNETNNSASIVPPALEPEDPSTPEEAAPFAPAVDINTLPQRRPRSAGAPPARPFADNIVNTIQSGIRSALSRDEIEGHWLSALVVDFDTGQLLFEDDPGRALKPASNTKLFTTAAALALFGPDHQFVTRVFADSAPVGGVVDGNIYVVGGYDFTWSEYFFPSGDWPVEVIVRQIAEAGVQRINGSVHLNGTFIINPHNFHALDLDDHRSDTANAFARHLRHAEISTGALQTGAEINVPAGATELTSYHSLSLGSAVVPINRISHNEMADALMLYIAKEQTGNADYEAGSGVIASLLNHWGIDTEGFRLFDGSGLSHDNRVTARQLLDVIQVAQTSSWADAFNRSLSISGFDGTFSGRLTGDDTRGRVFAKTGTINRVVTTAGFLLHKNLNHRIGFAILMNEMSDQDAARAVHNRIVDAFAGDLTAAGAPLDNPEISTFVYDKAAARALLAWQPVDRAEQYHVEWTAAREGWAQSDSAIQSDREIHIPWRLSRGPLLARVRAAKTDTFGPPSDVYAIVPSEQTSRTLVVDGNDRFENRESAGNGIGAGHSFVADVVGAIATRGADSASNQAVRSRDVDLADYQLVIWLLGEESSEDVTLDDQERSMLRSYIEGGGAFIISGSELAFDLSEQGSADAIAFLNDTLSTGLVDDTAQVEMAEGAGPCAAQRPLHFLAPGTMAVRYPDTLNDDNATRCLSYATDPPAAAAVIHPSLPIVTVGFPIEATETAEERARLMTTLIRALHPR